MTALQANTDECRANTIHTGRDTQGQAHTMSCYGYNECVLHVCDTA